MKVSAAGLDCIKGHEGLRLKAYLDTGGVWTIGYGHTAGVKEGDTCTPEQAYAWLDEDADIAERAINQLVKVPLTQNQFDALVSFVYNIGRPEFFTSTLLRKLNAGDYTGAAGQFGRWIYDNGKIINGLVLRRSDERDLFVTGIGD
jgi:Phage-related lysozyme (muraminidase)